MSCTDFKEELKRWLDTALSTPAPEGTAAPSALRDHAEGCPVCGEKLRTAEALFSMRTVRESTPPFLTSRVLGALSDRKPGRKNTKAWLIGLPSAAMVTLALLLILLWGSNGGVVVRFTLAAPAATRVHVVGDWNGWNLEAHPLADEDGDGVWETELKLHPGKEYRYQFYINKDTWIADPDAPLSIEDGFGGLNSILRI